MLMLTEMFSQLHNTICEEGNLNLRRPSVAFMLLELLDDYLFVFGRWHRTRSIPTLNLALQK